MPIYTKTVVKYRDTTICFWMVELITLVLEDGCLAQNCEAMGKTSWDKELTMIILCKLNCHMLTISRRSFTNINGDIENCPLYDSYQFALSKWWSLKMQASHDSIRGHTFIVLNKIDRTHFLLKLSQRE